MFVHLPPLLDVRWMTDGGQCADITFSKDAKAPSSDVCTNSTGVGASPLDYDGPENKTGSTSAATHVVGGYGAGSIVVAVAAAAAVAMLMV